MKKSILILILLVLVGVFIYYFQKNKRIFPGQNGTGSTIINQETGGLINYSENGINLEIIQPKDQAVVNETNLTIKGKTTAGAEIFINDLQLTADEQGNFQANIILDEGENIIAIVSNDSEGNFAEKELSVTLETVE